MLSNLFSLSGISAAPFVLIGILSGNKVLAVASLCWLLSHFVGYLTRMVHEEHKQLCARLHIIEASLSVTGNKSEGPFPRVVSMN